MLKRVRSFLQRLFPPQLQAYIPGKKLVAGGVLYVLASAFGIGGDQVVELPLVGDVTVSEAALGLGVYLFPEKPVEIEIEAPSSDPDQPTT